MGISPAGRDPSSWTTRAVLDSVLPTIAPSFDAKQLKKVRGDTPAAAAISSTVTPIGPDARRPGGAQPRRARPRLGLLPFAQPLRHGEPREDRCRPRRPCSRRWSTLSTGSAGSAIGDQRILDEVDLERGGRAADVGRRGPQRDLLQEPRENEAEQRTTGPRTQHARDGVGERFAAAACCRRQLAHRLGGDVQVGGRSEQVGDPAR